MNVESGAHDAEPAGEAPKGGSSLEVDEADFRARYGEYVRRLVRDEVERALRLAAE
jgi:hypothetical protein